MKLILCGLAQINFGIITNIGKAHLEGFKSIKGVTKAKKNSSIIKKIKEFYLLTPGQITNVNFRKANRILYNRTKQDINNSTFAEITN